MKSLTQFLSENKTQQALIVVKPGFTEYTPEILKMYQSGGWEICRMRTTRLDMGLAKVLYAPHKKEDFFEPLCKYMCSGLCTAIVLTRKGPVEPYYLEDVSAIKDKIRKKWGESEMRNVLHSTDSLERLPIEIGVFF